MKQEQKQTFTRRITQCNKGGMIVIIYDILFAYIEDAKEAYQKESYEEMKTALTKAQLAADELIGALDFHYPIAKELYPLYIFVKEAFAKTIIKNNLTELDGAEAVLKDLYEAFVKAAAQDTSEPLMRNTQQVYAGMTYGRNDLTETFRDSETSRGFFA